MSLIFYHLEMAEELLMQKLQALKVLLEGLKLIFEAIRIVNKSPDGS
jgi:hypothetical protein